MSRTFQTAPTQSQILQQRRPRGRPPVWAGCRAAQQAVRAAMRRGAPHQGTPLPRPAPRPPLAAGEVGCRHLYHALQWRIYVCAVSGKALDGKWLAHAMQSTSSCWQSTSLARSYLAIYAMTIIAQAEMLCAGVGGDSSRSLGSSSSDGSSRGGRRAWPRMIFGSPATAQGYDHYSLDLSCASALTCCSVPCKSSVSLQHGRHF